MMKTNLYLCCVLIILTGVYLKQCWAICYFPQDVQGHYVMQTGPEAPYTMVNISADTIHIFGQCHRRIGNNVILTMESNGRACYRCLHLKLRSRNVLQIHTVLREYLSKCFTNETLAVCPQKEDFQKPITELVLYKKYKYNGEMVQKEYCPIHGKFIFTYDKRNGKDNKVCFTGNSTIDSCPSGSELNLNFMQCTFDNNVSTFECLGHWEGRNADQQFLALYGPLQSENERKYRCAIYKEEENGSISIAISDNDSSHCPNSFYQTAHGYEVYNLTAIPQNNWPSEVQLSRCSFPTWLIGKWQHIIVNENTFLYKDHSSFKTYTFKCLANSNSNDSKIAVFSRTQCGEESYNCLWIKQRSTNVMEFQMGIKSNPHYFESTLCSDSNFLANTWITQARLRKEPGECPVSGEYMGQLPDVPEYCAKLSSDCQQPDIMYYTVSDCTYTNIYEERKYKCLGQWEEDSLLYTYTQRLDLAPSFHECFVGSIINDNEISIMEAGEQCQRFNNPLQHGMKLYRQGKCNGTHPSPKPIIPNDDSIYNVYLTTQSTNHWTPTSVTPFTEFDSGASDTQRLPLSIALLLLTIYRLI